MLVAAAEVDMEYAKKKKKRTHYADPLFAKGNQGERKRQVAVTVSRGLKDEKGTTLFSLQGADLSPGEWRGRNISLLFNVFMVTKRKTLLAHDFLMSSQADIEANTRHNDSLNMWILWIVITAEWILNNTNVTDHESECMCFKCLLF